MANIRSKVVGIGYHRALPHCNPKLAEIMIIMLINKKKANECASKGKVTRGGGRGKNLSIAIFQKDTTFTRIATSSG